MGPSFDANSALRTYADSPGDGSAAQIYTPFTEHTSSQEVLQLARSWIATCTGPEHAECPSETIDDRNRSSARYYPTRLIELPPYHSKPYEKQDISDKTVRLVTTNGWPIHPPQESVVHASVSLKNPYQSPTTRSETLGPSFAPPGLYVTLSHCWGSSKFIKLTKENCDDFEKGIALGSLPKTFQQAIDFASRLRKDVRYIWIDALCIIQDSEDDWNTESVKMYDVYHNSFCNISATNANDNSEGLYSQRDPQRLWENEIRLNTDGIPTSFPQKSQLGVEPLLRRCGILDATFWARSIEDAPVNRRAWVLQERLLAPRVLHFGFHQIAWECRHLEATESLPYGTSNLEVKDGVVVETTRLKSSLAQDYVPRSLVPDAEHLAWQAHECWKRIIERYSTTSITKESDRLIALAGIAQMSSRQIGSKVLYVAGLWEKWLASQLLWRVNSDYSDGKYSFPQRRAKTFIAPTFSWARILAKQGIKCGETVREDRLLFAVKHISLPQKTDKDRFSLVESDESVIYIELGGRLAAINLVKGKGSGITRYRWNLTNGNQNPKRDLSGLYLDSPEDDASLFENAQAGLHCMPAYRNAKNYTICLILRLVDGEVSPHHYKRVGLAMVPSYEAMQLALERGKLDRTSFPRTAGVSDVWRDVRVRLY